MKRLPREFQYDFAVGHRLLMPSARVGVHMWVGLLVGNGFVRIYTNRGRGYLVSQVSAEHATPDWKVHFSIAHEDIPRAWNAFAATVLSRAEENPMIAIKAIALNAHWPASMRGRELTMYVFRYDPAYGCGLPVRREDGKNALLPMRPEDERGDAFWLSLVAEIERALEAAGIAPNGCADGDYAIGRYASLRNEAYVVVNGELAYPPNNHGWNAAQHALPFSKRKLLQMHASALFRNTRADRPSLFFAIVVAAIVACMLGVLLLLRSSLFP